jgi:hypothetical protein
MVPTAVLTRIRESKNTQPLVLRFCALGSTAWLQTQTFHSLT